MAKRQSFGGFEKNMNRYFVLQNDVLYCTDERYEFAVKWNGEKWNKCEYEEVGDNAKEISPQKAFKLATCPPWETFDLIIAKIREDSKNYWENLISTTTKKVIGYTNIACGSDCFFSVENGRISEEEYACIIKDFRENGYLFSGEDFQDSYHDCTPVLENYRYVDFSRRGFGRLIAMSRGDYSEMGYCHYTESMFINPDALHFPKGGLKKEFQHGASEIIIDDITYKEFVGEMNKPNKFLTAVIIPKDEKGYYWENDVVTLKHEDENFKVQVKAIVRFSENSLYDKFKSNRRLNCTDWREEFTNNVVLLVAPYIEDEYDLLDNEFLSELLLN